MDAHFTEYKRFKTYLGKRQFSKNVSYHFYNPLFLPFLGICHTFFAYFEDSNKCVDDRSAPSKQSSALCKKYKQLSTRSLLNLELTIFSCIHYTKIAMLQFLNLNIYVCNFNGCILFLHSRYIRSFYAFKVLFRKMGNLRMLEVVGNITSARHKVRGRFNPGI